MALTSHAKRRRCRICGTTFVPTRPLQPACSNLSCMIAVAEVAAAKSAKSRAKKMALERAIEKKQDKVKREGMKSLSELRKEAQTAINRYRRMADIKAGYNCICCGKPFEQDRPGGSVDAGHYLSRGSHPNLAFVEMNINAQRKSCNRPGGTTAAQFRIGMIDRYGLKAVEDLEADKTPRRYRAEEYREIRDRYREKVKRL